MDGAGIVETQEGIKIIPAIAAAPPAKARITSPVVSASAPNSGSTAIAISRPTGWVTISTASTGMNLLCSPPRKSETPQESPEARLTAKASSRSG